MSFAAALISLILSIHRALYQPYFPPVPVVRTVSPQDKISITLPLRKLTGTDVPPIEAGSFLVIDRESGEVLAQNQADLKLPPASTTKIMTAVIALENMDGEKVVTVPPDIDGEGSVMKLKTGENIRIKDLVTGMLVHSSNDAAEMLAYSYPGGKDAFVEAMNEKAVALQMRHTHYKNPSGLPDQDHYTTVRDLLILARYAMDIPAFAQTVKMKQAVITSADGRILHKVETTNKLLGDVDGIEGIKTGWTEEAGECLVTQVTRGGHTILTALLRSPDRFAETKSLINWVYNGFYWETKTVTAWK